MFETFSDSRVCVCPRVPAIPRGASFQTFQWSTPTEGVEMEAARPLPESPACGRARLRRLWGPARPGLSEQQLEAERAEGPRLGHRSRSLLPASSAHPSARKTLEQGRRAVSAQEAGAARCKLLVQACLGRLARRGLCPDPAWRLPAS